MKKLLVMILMVGVALPVFAKEVKLQCKLGDRNGEAEIWSFDEAAGTVTFSWDQGGTFSTNKKCKGVAGTVDVCYEVYITPEEFGMKRFWSWEDKPHNKLSIDRMDGTMRWSDSVRGTCVPFKQAF